MEAERRQVTVLFADVVGFTAYSERAGEEAAYTLKCARKALITWVRCRISRSRVRCSINWLCCSADLTCTKRMVGRRTASQIASASAASFLLRFT